MDRKFYVWPVEICTKKKVVGREMTVDLHTIPDCQLECFRSFVDCNALMDIDLKGGSFTWFSNSKNGFIIKERIDRALANWEWKKLYQTTALVARLAISFNHCPVFTKF
ncbi:hypothetical protein Ahy_A08g040005 [Arachis hypogaea]|uniref:Reverse transcriptase zinc-binding domain-containing protein n=1 Tax=Arachis hypogaea TaxID=3818 RepID=A0A445BYK8_ARAHY|nr:hypothetical protein Ahy_A08g040005 [Arachis hypogaea]